MNPIQLFIIRAILGIGIAIVITRAFRGEIQLPFVIGLSAVIIGLAYLKEYLRKRR